MIMTRMMPGVTRIRADYHRMPAGPAGAAGRAATDFPDSKAVDLKSAWESESSLGRAPAAAAGDPTVTRSLLTGRIATDLLVGGRGPRLSPGRP